MASITEYKKGFDIAIKAAEQLLFNIKDKISNFDPVDAELNDIDYDGIIYNLEQQINEFHKHRVRYRFDKMSEEEFDLMLKNTAEGKPITLITIGLNHKLNKYDTPQSLIVQYGVTLEDILEYNKITLEELDDKIELNVTIKIPISINLKESTVYSEIPVFGSHRGSQAWGTDWENEISIDATTGDIKVLNNTDTLIQTIQNRFGEYGDIPGYEDQTIDFGWGEDIPRDLIDGMTLAKISQQFSIDKRIKEIVDIIITDASSISKIVTIKLLPVNSDALVEAIVQKQNEQFVKTLQ